MLDVDEGGDASTLLGLGDDSQREGRLARGLGAEDLDDTTLGETADAKGAVDEEIPRGDGGDVDRCGFAETHDGAIPVILGYCLDG